MLLAAFGRDPGHKDIVHTLLCSGADISAVDNCGLTALDLAVQFMNDHIVPELVEYGARGSFESQRHARALVAGSTQRGQ